MQIFQRIIIKYKPNLFFVQYFLNFGLVFTYVVVIQELVAFILQFKGT
jgi:hypothetical protein